MSSTTSGLQLDPASEFSSAWKQEINKRLAAHRNRRGQSAQQPALPGMEEAAEAIPPKSRSVADRVAARYANAPSYSEMLALEAQNAARAAEAAAKAANEAHAAAQAILAGLDAEAELPELESLRDEDPEPAPEPAYRAQLPPHLVARRQAAPPGPRRLAATEERTGSEDPFEEALVTPVQPLPANLIEFPRELIAPRKARPRLAEGPLIEDTAASGPQLRIFEVASDAISTAPKVDPVLPEWSSIRLEAHPQPESEQSQGVHARSPRHQERNPPKSTARKFEQSGQQPNNLELPLQAAPIADRLMAAIVDFSLVVTGFLLFVLVFVSCTAHPPTGKPALIGGGAILFGFFLVYQFLFFKFGQDTPGMRYAKIALCTFEDDNPTRQVALRRIGALLLSAAPLGLGLLWALFDDDRLGWHDRISRTYQRSYR